jgi:hypothetical protein
LDEFEKAHVQVVIIGGNPNTKIWSAGQDIREIPLEPLTGENINEPANISTHRRDYPWCARTHDSGRDGAG